MTAEQRETKRMLDEFFRDCKRDPNASAVMDELDERLDSDPCSRYIRHREKIKKHNNNRPKE